MDDNFHAHSMKVLAMARFPFAFQILPLTLTCPLIEGQSIEPRESPTNDVYLTFDTIMQRHVIMC